MIVRQKTCTKSLMRTRKIKECLMCQKSFILKSPTGLTCSLECSKELKSRRRREWISSNRDYFNSYKRNYHKTKDKERVALKMKALRKTAKYKHYRKRQQQERLRRDPLYKAKRCLRKRLWHYKQQYGSVSMSKSIGCTWGKFVEHMELQFYDCPRTKVKMNWLNYGKQTQHDFPKWEIDHIIPLCTAKSANDLEKLSHYTNLQPLWHIDNNLKSLKDIKL